MPNLTLKKVLKRHRENPQDKKLHNIIESQQINEEKMDKTLSKILDENVVVDK